ncbi:MAG: hypothetical protein ACRDHP_12985, partial [Ktedonobacterales bacterium]
MMRRLALPPRYAAIVLGCLLFLVASDGAVLLRGATATPLIGLGTLLASLLGMGCLIGAVYRRPTPSAVVETSSDTPHLAVRAGGRPPDAPTNRASPVRTFLRYLILAVGAALALDSVIAALLGVTLLLAPPSQAYPTDAISFAHADAALVLAGVNPYTADNHFPEILAAYPHTLATPLRGRVFGMGDEYPSDARILAVQRRYLADPASEMGAFDPATLHSYPALSFLLYVPLLAVGLRNILVLHLLVYVGLFVWLVSLAPPGLRRWAALVAAANAIILGYSFLGDAQGICLALVLAAWHFRNRRFAGPILLGLACAYRQYCWFFVPFFLLAWAFPSSESAVSPPLSVRGEGAGGEVPFSPRRLMCPALLTLAAFLLPNLLYIVASPGPWLASLWLPMTDPMFPAGMGLDALSIGHLLPYVPSPVYGVLEALALAGALWAAWRWRDRLGDGALLLALVPLFV